MHRCIVEAERTAAAVEFMASNCRGFGGLTSGRRPRKHSCHLVINPPVGCPLTNALYFSDFRFPTVLLSRSDVSPNCALIVKKEWEQVQRRKKDRPPFDGLSIRGFRKH